VTSWARNIFISFFLNGHERSIRANKNILISLCVKGMSICLSLVLIPLTIGYVNPSRYGIWLTLSSILTWINIFDIGLGNGLRNKLAQALADQDTELAKIYVSTTFAALIVIIGLITLLFGLILPFINLNHVFNSTDVPQKELLYTVIIVFVCVCLQFVLKILNTVLLATQRPAVNDVIIFFGSVFSFIIIYLLTKFVAGSLVYLGLVLGGVPVLMMVYANVYFFARDYKAIAPSPAYVRLEHVKDLCSLGVQFFVIQIVYMLVFFTYSIIITQLLSPKDVTVYYIAFKYFSIITMVFDIIRNPYWSAYTEAYYKDDIPWITRTTKKLTEIWGALSLLAVCMVLIAPAAYKLWVGSKVAIPMSLTIAMGVYVVVANWNNIFVTFICGSGKIRLHFYHNIIIGLVTVPLAILFTRNWQLAGLVVSSTLSIIGGVVLGPYQYHKLISKTAKGIWAR
jgi:O-antigen/teichoic acid export membrane protein